MRVRARGGNIHLPDEFKAQCSDKSVWDIEIQSKRTGFNPKGNWAASGASATAFEASDEDL